ncbi:MAG: hypothetical protein ACI85K_003307 [Hyphomicrobiaceae bacterium]|jgi:hypothetical protein
MITKKQAANCHCHGVAALCLAAQLRNRLADGRCTRYPVILPQKFWRMLLCT